MGRPRRGDHQPIYHFGWCPPIPAARLSRLCAFFRELTLSSVADLPLSFVLLQQRRWARRLVRGLGSARGLADVWPPGQNSRPTELVLDIAVELRFEGERRGPSKRFVDGATLPG